MAVWALGDLHLSFGVPNKKMDVFGAQWKDHPEKIQNAWLARIAPDDLVLLPGDISWAMRIEEVVPDLEWIHRLPGTKVMIRGNHDYWWTSLSKIEKVLPSSIHLIQNNAFNWKGISIAGARLWDTSEYQFNAYIDFVENPVSKEMDEIPYSNPDEDQRIFLRELSRLELSLKSLNQAAPIKMVMTHYPPVGADLQPSLTTSLLEKYHIQYCVFGHLHNVKTGSLKFGERNGIFYSLTSADYLNFEPLKILD